LFLERWVLYIKIHEESANHKNSITILQGHIHNWTRQNLCIVTPVALRQTAR